VESLVWLALNKDTLAAVAYAGRALAQGLSVDALLLDLLAPAARRMGALWNDDAADFGQVTIGLSCLHQVLREVEIASEIEEGAPNQDRLLKRHALLMGTPGDQHSFGLTMVRTFFRRAGWTVWNGSTSSGGDIARTVRGHWLTVAGFSLGAEVRLDSLRRTISTVRQASQNPRIHIMVGGPMFIEHPALVAQVGADAMAVDGRQAVMQAESLLMLPQRC